VVAVDDECVLLSGGLVNPDTIGISGVRSEVKTEVVSDKSG